ncbi:MAG: hypothetical protein AOA65_0805 [Candidatus Bathyarchaeota archaeon BA1]|nr:MAG: hypothetical protein AOA65_0805 [Candidatus Bathyarchaeota archaeon BA1]
MVKLVRIVISKFGEISDEEVDSAVKTMEECYERLKPHKVELVDVCLFERSSTAEAFLSKESAEVGVVSASFGELFFATHEAWRGTPRITLCFEKMRKLPKLVQVGGIRHEVGHSVLHGSLRYYLLLLPTVFLDMAKHFGLSTQYVTNLLYLTSIAVKDCEVSRLLYGRGYLEDQAAYAKHTLTISESDTLSWEVSRGKPISEILCLVSCLKAAGCAAPLFSDERLGEEMKRRLMESLSYLPTDYSTLLFDVILEGFSSLGADTLSNIEQMARLIADKIIKPILERRG